MFKFFHLITNLFIILFLEFLNVLNKEHVFEFYRHILCHSNERTVEVQIA